MVCSRKPMNYLFFAMLRLHSSSSPAVDAFMSTLTIGIYLVPQLMNSPCCKPSSSAHSWFFLLPHPKGFVFSFCLCQCQFLLLLF
ncbi:hypothetical protein NC653_027492 [Populus alba x Populus x berolinensis]|uniref:Uncharacterized protein n=1 Tax=Populus alba x Populus x berolinensis TaxID=444605 RepID=A0AAD6M7Z9_9ROSI|nr:hypothetical protein NC653_027492 [Populus alba x Populus x berolinensis]